MLSIDYDHFFFQFFQMQKEDWKFYELTKKKKKKKGKKTKKKITTKYEDICQKD